jgi:hypothetical protein
MAQSLEDKAAKAIINALADLRFNEVGFVNRFHDQPHDIQAKFYNVLVAYVYTMAHNYELGLFPHGTYEISRMCKKIKDLVFSDEYSTIKYAQYGDYEMEGGNPDLTLFDM